MDLLDGQVIQAIPVQFGDNVVPDTPLILVQPFRLRSDNAIVPRKTVWPRGPQVAGYGQGQVNFHTNGLSLTPDIRAWLETAGQPPVGMTIRHARTTVPAAWDSRYVVQDGVVDDGSGVT